MRQWFRVTGIIMKYAFKLLPYGQEITEQSGNYYAVTNIPYIPRVGILDFNYFTILWNNYGFLYHFGSYTLPIWSPIQVVLDNSMVLLYNGTASPFLFTDTSWN